MTTKVVYIIGAMSNRENYNHALFYRVEKLLTAMGFVVINPANLPIGMDYIKYMNFSIASVTSCDFLYKLPNSDDSHGVLLENTLANSFSKPVYESFNAVPAEFFKSKPPECMLSNMQKYIDEYQQQAIKINA